MDFQLRPYYFGGFCGSDGCWEKTIAFRIDDPVREGFKRIVCGCCVPADDVADSRINRGSALCESCQRPVGRAQAHSAAIRKEGWAAA